MKARFDPVVGLGLALAYEALPHDDDPLGVSSRSWRAMAEEEVRLFTQATKLFRIQPWPGDGQPYSSSREMGYDVRLSRHLYVFTGGDPHPYRSADETYRGRAVHDIYGHALPEHSFSADGELAAWRATRMMYSAEAQLALATDNLGPTAYYYFHPRNVGKPHAARVWPEQKIRVFHPNVYQELLG